MQRRSILDALVGELTSLRKDLGPADRRVVNQYVDEIREIERRLELAAKASSDVPVFDLPPGVPEQFDEHIKLHYDLLALAFKADITRVATLLGARDLTNRVYTFPKSPLFPDGGTSVSFHGGVAPPGRSGADPALRADQPLSRVDARATSRRSCGRFPKATARCWITR